jgi:magnesium and cobalt transporter
VLLAKDLLRYSSKSDGQTFSIRELLRPAVFVPESKRLNVLLKEFRASRNHIAVVVDEYGGVAGMVTIEDVLEQIVGEIEDEHDIDEETFIRKFSDTNYAVKALTPIEDFNEYFDTGFSDEEFDTIGGLVTAKLGHLPKRGETVLLENMSFQIIRADNRRLHLMKVTLLPGANPANSQVDA